MKKFWLFSLTLLLTALQAAAETVPFRGGDVLAAEISTVKPAIRNDDTVSYKNDYNRKVYAAVTVRMTPGRKLSIHDYSLEAFGVSYPCIAVKAGSREYDLTSDEIADPSKEKCTMLFLLDGSQFGIDKSEKLDIQCNFPPASGALWPIRLRNLGSQPFTPTEKIPDGGTMQVDK